MIPSEEWDAIQARRALLREQTKLVGARLAWLADPALIPEHAVDSSVTPDDLQLAAFSLAGWMLIEIVQAADQVYQKLDWEGAIKGFRVAARLQESVSRAVLCPAARHAPGLFAMAEIIAVVPMVASRSGLARDRWREVANRSQDFGAMLAHDGTAVQILIRSYLSSADTHAGGRVRSLNPALLQLDDKGGLTTVTPLAGLLSAARDAATRHNEWYHATCVAMQAPAPEAVDRTRAATMFGAIWSSFVAAADRFVFPRFDPSRDSVDAEAGPDPSYAQALDRLAAGRRETLAEAASQPYPTSVERVLSNLLSARGGPSPPG